MRVEDGDETGDAGRDDRVVGREDVVRSIREAKRSGRCVVGRDVR